MTKRGRPQKKTKDLEKLDFTTFQEDITIFKNYLLDVVNNDTEDMIDEEDEDPNVPIISKFLEMETWKQNIFIIYLLNKDRRIKNNKFTFKALAQLLQVESVELMRVIKQIKKELNIK